MVKAAKSERSLLLLDIDDSSVFDFLRPLCSCEQVTSEQDAMALIRENRFGVILAGYSFGGAIGADLVSAISLLAPDSSIILIGSEEESHGAIDCFRAGAFDFIRKPFELDHLETAVSRAFDKFESRVFRTSYQASLEDLVSERTAALDRALEDVENSYRVTLKALAQALETRDFETHGHSERVVTFSLRLGYEIGLEQDAMKDLELGALLHDIGKIGVPDAILRKPGRLTALEWEKMKLHPVHGFRILKNIPFLEGAAKVVSQHHERWDGKGYPNGLKGEAIDIGARIFSVIDAFDAMISDRVYRAGRNYDDAVAELEECAGSQFDPMIVEAFKNVPRDDWQILRERSVKDKKEVFSFQAIVEELVRSRREVELVH